MGFLRRIADAFEPPREKRADPSWAALSGGAADWTSAMWRSPSPPFAFGTDGRPTVTPRLAENLATALACISAISGAISSLPAWVYRLSNEGRTVDPAHDLSRMIREGPNRRQSWPEFIEWLTAQTLAHGNGLAEIVADRAGRVVALEPIPWPNVTPLILASGRLAYDVSPMTSLSGGTGAIRRLLDTEVVHLKDRSDDGLIGRARLARCASPARTALNQEAFGEYLYANRATPSGIIAFKQSLSEDQRDFIRHGIDRNWAGVRNSGKVLILDNDADFKSLTITPESLEMLAARRFSTEEIARLYGVPPPIIGIWDHSTFTNSETAGRWFAQFCLAPWIRKIEEAFRRSVFSAADRGTHEIEFDMTGFLRGDAEARWKAHEIAVKNRILTANEIREVEGWNPRPELDAAPPADPAASVL